VTNNEPLKVFYEAENRQRSRLEFSI